MRAEEIVDRMINDSRNIKGTGNETPAERHSRLVSTFANEISAENKVELANLFIRKLEINRKMVILDAELDAITVRMKELSGENLL